MARRQQRSDSVRRRVAHEAARLIAEHGIDDYLLAKRKAAERLGVTDKASLPRNSEIEAALAENQRLFSSLEHPRLLQNMRSTARQAMRLFESFSPRLVGSVLNGTAAVNNDVELHLFTDTPELVAVRLIQDHIPHRVAQRRMRITGDRYQPYPAYKFVAGDIGIEAVVFPAIGMRQAPISPIDGRPMRRASLAELEDLLSAESVRETQVPWR